MSSKCYRPWNPDQMVLFPPAMRDALEQGHIVFRIMDVVERSKAVTNLPPDTDHLAPMLERVRCSTGQLPRRLSADAGYMSESNVEVCEDREVDAYLAVGRDRHGADGVAEGPRRDSEVWHGMRDKLRSEEGRSIHARRKVIVEPVYGHAKQARGFRRFSVRGLWKVRAEWTLVCLCGNLLKLVNFASARPPMAAEVAERRDLHCASRGPLRVRPPSPRPCDLSGRSAKPILSGAHRIAPGRRRPTERRSTGYAVRAAGGPAGNPS